MSSEDVLGTKKQETSSSSGNKAKVAAATDSKEAGRPEKPDD